MYPVIMANTIINSDKSSEFGLKFPNIIHLEIGCNNIKILDLSYFHNLKISFIA